MALFEIILQSEFQGQSQINRWNYEGSVVPAAVQPTFALYSAFGALATANSVFNALRAICTPEVRFDAITVNNLYTLTDFYTTAYPTGTTGTLGLAGDAPPSFVATKFTSSRSRRDIRSATKSFSGLGETYIGAGGLIVGVVTGFLDTMASRMGATLTYDDEGTLVTFNPVVLGRKEYTTPKGNRAYQYYPTLAEQSGWIASASLWSWNPYVTTQNSRKRGRGI